MGYFGERSFIWEGAVDKGVEWVDSTGVKEAAVSKEYKNGCSEINLSKIRKIVQSITFPIKQIYVCYLT